MQVSKAAVCCQTKIVCTITSRP